jgi:hypothetical protein
LTSKSSIILDAIEKLNPKLREECQVDIPGDGTEVIYGPFPSFIIQVPTFGDCRVIVHVNADAPNMAWLFAKLALALEGMERKTSHPELAFDGAFAVEGETGNLIVGPDAYKKKEENILMFAKEIMTRRQEQKEGILVPDKKIILA